VSVRVSLVFWPAGLLILALGPGQLPAADASLALVNGTLLDGTAAAPVERAVVLIEGGRIRAAGPSSAVVVPTDARIVDVSGAFILPGFINAHVHDAFDEERLRAWAQAGVTTVRDEGITGASRSLADLMALRQALAASPRTARLVSAGYMITVPDGYGSLDVTSPEDARRKVNWELDQGVDLVKVALETGYGAWRNLPIPSDEELRAVVAAAHERGRFVSAHVTQAQYLAQVVAAGVDDAAHAPGDPVPDSVIRRMVADGVHLVPTLTVLEAYGALAAASQNLRRMAAAGVVVALGNDYTAIPQNGFDHFELGMPMHEITRMAEAGMSPIRIITAATRDAAHVCGLDAVLGTIEAGKIADVLVVNGNPLVDLGALIEVRMVIHDGEVIRPADWTR
jgi:imidazolonepropionase-like amidohydrolase